jgi:hypothetical protein
MILLVPQNMAHIVPVNKCEVLKRVSDPSNYFICGIYITCDRGRKDYEHR